MNNYQDSPMKIIVMADGATDYLFLYKVIDKDPDISKLPISILKNIIKLYQKYNN